MCRHGEITKVFSEIESQGYFSSYSQKKKKILRICLIWLHFLPTALITDLADCKLDLINKGSSLDRHREVSAEETLLNSN